MQRKKTFGKSSEISDKIFTYTHYFVTHCFYHTDLIVKTRGDHNSLII